MSPACFRKPPKQANAEVAERAEASRRSGIVCLVIARDAKRPVAIQSLDRLGTLSGSTLLTTLSLSNGLVETA